MAGNKAGPDMRTDMLFQMLHPQQRFVSGIPLTRLGPYSLICSLTAICRMAAEYLAQIIGICCAPLASVRYRYFFQTRKSLFPQLKGPYWSL